MRKFLDVPGGFQCKGYKEKLPILSNKLSLLSVSNSDKLAGIYLAFLEKNPDL